MQDRLPHRRIDLNSGIYTVSEVCRILPGMTPRKVHYWLNTDLLSAPIRRGGRGYPTLLSYRQVLEIRTVQHLREDLEFSLRSVRRAFDWILERLFLAAPLTFARGSDLQLVALYRGEQMTVPGGQGVLDGVIPELNQSIVDAREHWATKVLPVAGYRWIVSRPTIQAGAPTIKGTRIQTSVVASFFDPEERKVDISEVLRSYPLRREAINEALTFEGVALAA